MLNTCVDRRTGRESAPDVTAVTGNLVGRCKWEALEELGSDHKPIVIELEGAVEGRKEERRLAWAWKKADWGKYKEELREWS